MRLGLGIVWTAVKTAVERGLPLFVLFLVSGLAVLLLTVAFRTTGPAFPAAMGLVGLVLWVAAAVIGINIMVDSGTKIELSSMYLTDYHGIAWTTANLFVGMITAMLVLLATSGLAWLPYLTRDAIPVQQFTAVTLTLPELYLLFVQAAAVIVTVYLAARILLFPAYIAVESNTVWTAVRNSWTASADEAHVLLLPLLFMAAVDAGVVLAALDLLPTVSTVIPAALPAPYGEALIGGGMLLSALAVAGIIELAVIATAYSDLR